MQDLISNIVYKEAVVETIKDADQIKVGSVWVGKWLVRAEVIAIIPAIHNEKHSHAIVLEFLDGGAFQAITAQGLLKNWRRVVTTSGVPKSLIRRVLFAVGLLYCKLIKV